MNFKPRKLIVPQIVTHGSQAVENTWAEGNETAQGALSLNCTVSNRAYAPH